VLDDFDLQDALPKKLINDFLADTFGEGLEGSAPEHAVRL